VFADDFNSLDLSRYVFYPSPWKDTSGRGTYAGSSRSSVANGILNVSLGVDATGPRSTAFIPLLPGGENQLYGRYAIRFRADANPGWKTAWLLWPSVDANWPSAGEIDFPEGNLNGTISAYMHRQGATSGSDQDAYGTTATYTSWHTAVIEWAPTGVTFILDGTVIGQSTSRIPAGPMHLVIQSETSMDSTTPATLAPIQIDWISVWSKA
jgi:hypothetical protein